MRRLTMCGAVVLVASGLLLAVTSQQAEGQVKQGKERPLKTHHLMKGLVAAQCGALKKDLDAGPADDKAWDTALMRAELLNEASYIVMADGRCPDGDWAKAATALRAGSAEVIEAVEARNLDQAKAAFGTMTKACGACHKKHKK